MADSILALAAHPPEDPSERKALYEAAKKLMFSVEGNHDVQHRVYYGGFPLYFANIAVDLGVFKALAADCDKAWSSEALAQHLDCEELLLSRVLRGLVAHGLVRRLPDGTFSSTATTAFFALPGREAGVKHNVWHVLPSMQRLPEFLRNHGKKSPTSANDNAFQLNFGDGFFSYLSTHPEDLKVAMDSFASQRADQVSWIKDDAVFPRELFEFSGKDRANARPLIVDIGGGSGHQLIEFRTSRPEYAGPLVLQDLPEVVESVDKKQIKELGIECMAHDFHTPQPVRDAKAYYLRTILHDWPNDAALKILQQLRPAMKEDSVLLVDEMVIADDEARSQQVNYDFVMMSVCGAVERTRDQWKRLFAAAGFALREVREYGMAKGTGDSLLIGVPV